MYLYLYRSDNNEKQQRGSAPEDRIVFREWLVRMALRDYSKRQGLGISDTVLNKTEIVKDSKGKPHFSGLSSVETDVIPDIHYSVSHSGEWWGCLMAEEPVGFDLEVCRQKVNYEKIAKRFFTEDECIWIRSAGPEAFFEVWVRKEAYVKYLGTGLAEGLDTFSTIEGGKLAARISTMDDGDMKQPTCFVRSYDLEAGVKAAYCSSTGNPIAETVILTLTEGH